MKVETTKTLHASITIGQTIYRITLDDQNDSFERNIYFSLPLKHHDEFIAALWEIKNKLTIDE